MWKQYLAGCGIALTCAAPALAASSATSTANLNIRNGPGTNFAVVGVIARDDAVTVSGCLAGTSWCQVSYGGIGGWSSARYLSPFNTPGAVRTYARADLTTAQPGLQRQVIYASTRPVITRPVTYAARNIAFAPATQPIYGWTRDASFTAIRPAYGWSRDVTFASTRPLYGSTRIVTFASTRPRDVTFAATEPLLPAAPSGGRYEYVQIDGQWVPVDSYDGRILGTAP
jgi:hypothetical protein